ncbi:competence/damage-inducible protein A [Lyngbya confervoides]|uniref:CinA-like protein n=1 Tax=Lyngbya confervoides BDU141951 TaxID=1574623 RepID=A0ABD4T183_9CYAN|nr:competence/damage-inducible protein A [Lyngbya confervoides]MCM1982294.1 competence/damage-inducible protein A [Lyngbya confervoides BDU141951]
MGIGQSAEIIAVGSELLLGEILNSNAQFLAHELAALGIPHHFQSVVGDNQSRIHSVLETAIARANLLIFTGGLGPTPDDLTLAAIAEFFNVPLVEHPDIWADIQAKFAQRQIIPSENNRKQAFLPEGAQPLPNPIGSAPGILWAVSDSITVITFPGVPRELRRMWEETAVPYLRQQGWCQGPLYRRILRFWGITESALAEKVQDLLYLSNPTVAPYASRGVIRLRLAAQANSPAEAEAIIGPVEQEIRQRCGLDYFGRDDQTLATVVGDLLRSQGQTLSVAESCSGGGIGYRLTSTSGSSDYFLGGVIAYHNAIKIHQLGVSPVTLAQEGAVSAEVAKQMAQGIQQRFQTDWGVSMTGIAGPTGGTATKPVGLIYIGIAAPSGQVSTYEFRGSAQRGREWIRDISISSALDYLRRTMMIQSPELIQREILPGGRNNGN